MKLLVGIRTNTIDFQVDYLYGYYTELGFDVVILCDESASKYESSYQKKISLHKFYLEKIGLRFINNFGWSCGDYFLYPMLLHFPNYDGYLLLEDDLILRLKSSNELLNYLGNKDICVPHYGVRPESWVWYEAAKKISNRDAVYGCMFGMIYMRKDLLNILYRSRVEYGKGYVLGEPWCGDEGFLLNNPNLKEYKVSDWKEFFSSEDLMIKYTSSGEIYYLNKSDFNKVMTNAVTHPSLVAGGGFDFLVRESKILKRQVGRAPKLSEKLKLNKDKSIDLVSEYLRKFV